MREARPGEADAAAQAICAAFAAPYSSPPRRCAPPLLRCAQEGSGGGGLRAARAIEAGCTAIVTGTGEPVGDEPNPSLANMLRCGFARGGSRLNYEAAR